MSSGQQVPPWLQEQVAKLQQAQQSLHSVQLQRQQLEAERAETARALEEVRKAADGDAVYKQAGTVMVRADRASLIAELEEREELAGTRSKVLEKQEARVREAAREQEAKINEMVSGRQAGSQAGSPSPKTGAS